MLLHTECTKITLLIPGKPTATVKNEASNTTDSRSNDTEEWSQGDKLPNKVDTETSVGGKTTTENLTGNYTVTAADTSSETPSISVPSVPPNIRKSVPSIPGPQDIGGVPVTPEMLDMIFKELRKG